ncbi:MAG: pimeloyl-ACP methyl ester carboxylesterase [bacterium]|jgi:pimeloyl-ACP methyl ester carboxylesterase
MEKLTVQPKEVTINLKNFKLAAKTWGHAKNPPILAIHGWLDNAGSFDKLAPLLADQLYIIAIDLPGHGNSDHFKDSHGYQFIDYIPFIFEIAQFFQWEHFSLLGHSLGAGVSSIASGVFPEKIHKLMLLDGLGPMTDLAEDSPKQMQTAIIKQQKEVRSPRTFKTIEEAIEARQRILTISDEGGRCIMERGLKQHNEHCLVLKSDQKLTSPSFLRLTEEQVLPFFEKISAPTLAIWAKSGWKIDTPQMEKRMNSISQLKSISIEGHHHFHLDAPQPIAKELLDFYFS